LTSGRAGTCSKVGLAVSLMIFSLPSAFGVYQIAASTAFAVRVPQDRRGQAMGIASVGVAAGQGAAFLAVVAAAQVAGPAAVIAVGGAAGAAVAFALTFRWRRVSPPGLGASRLVVSWEVSPMLSRSAFLRRRVGGCEPEHPHWPDVAAGGHLDPGFRAGAARLRRDSRAWSFAVVCGICPSMAAESCPGAACLVYTDCRGLASYKRAIPPDGMAPGQGYGAQS
jgi:hypothetical protein